MDRRSAREEAFKRLFQIDMNETIELNDINAFTKKIITGVINHKSNIDHIIKEYLVNWTYDRIALVDKTILRIATFEIIYLEDIPYAVSINEAVELAHKYGDDRSSKFINGVLSKISKKGDHSRDC